MLSLNKIYEFYFFDNWFSLEFVWVYRKKILAFLVKELFSFYFTDM
jgi:hypothetical protein